MNLELIDISEHHDFNDISIFNNNINYFNNIDCNSNEFQEIIRNKNISDFLGKQNDYEIYSKVKFKEVDSLEKYKNLKHFFKDNLLFFRLKCKIQLKDYQYLVNPDLIAMEYYIKEIGFNNLQDIIISNGYKFPFKNYSDFLISFANKNKDSIVSITEQFNLSEEILDLPNIDQESLIKKSYPHLSSFKISNLNILNKYVQILYSNRFIIDLQIENIMKYLLNNHKIGVVLKNIIKSDDFIDFHYLLDSIVTFNEEEKDKGLNLMISKGLIHSNNRIMSLYKKIQNNSMFQYILMDIPLFESILEKNIINFDFDLIINDFNFFFNNKYFS